MSNVVWEEIKSENNGDFYLIKLHTINGLKGNEDYFINIPVDDTKEIFRMDISKHRKEKVSLPTIHHFIENSAKGLNIVELPKVTKNMPRYYSYIDSSIWHMAAFSEDDLMLCKKLINRNYLRHLYNLSVAQEYEELHYRLFTNAHLSTDSGHGQNVSPFIFHSELFMMREIDRLFGCQIEQRLRANITETGEMSDTKIPNTKEIYQPKKYMQTLKKYSWRFMLLDDKGVKNLSVIKGKKDIQCNKFTIIANILQDAGFSVGSCVVETEEDRYKLMPVSSKITNPDIMIFCAQNIEEAKFLLGSYKFEIILLDYLLEEELGKNRMGQKQSVIQYGYELLKDIITEDKKAIDKEWYENKLSILKGEKEELSEKEKENFNKGLCKEHGNKKISINSNFNPEKIETYRGQLYYKFGPHKRSFFMFISAFTTAVSERILAEGLRRSEKFWHIAEGACPTNTPWLFLYNLLQLMKKRIDDAGITKLSKEGIKEIIKDIYTPKNSHNNTQKNTDFPSIRQRANEKFNEVLSLLYHYKNLLNDVEIQDKSIFNTHESVLATDFISQNPNLGGLLEHLTQLVYLTAFGTIRQWPEMWEEYRSITSTYGNDIQCIEEYIMQLKSKI